MVARGMKLTVASYTPILIGKLALEGLTAPFRVVYSIAKKMLETSFFILVMYALSKVI